MQVNGQCQEGGQPHSSHPYLSCNANGSYRGYTDNPSCNIVRALVGGNSMHNVGVTLQRQNNVLATNDSSPRSNHLNYHSNSAQNSTSQNKTPAATLSQVMLTQKASMCANPQSAMLNCNAVYCQAQAMHQHPSNVGQNSRFENVSVPRTNPTSPTIQRLCYTQQPAVQSSMYNQTSQQVNYTSHAQNINVAFSNVPSTHNGEIYTASLVAPMCMNNNLSVQNNYFVSQTNDHLALRSVNGCSSLSNAMITNNANGQVHSQRTAPVQTQYPPHQRQQMMQQTSFGGTLNLKRSQSVIQGINHGNNVNTSSAPLPSQTYMQKNVHAAPLQTTIPGKGQSFNPLNNSLFYHRMNDASNNLNLHSSLNQASEFSKCEASTTMDTSSPVQAKDCTLQVSPGRAQRAVAVVLPLSQESTPTKHRTPSSLSSSNHSFLHSSHMNKDMTLDTLCLKQKLQHSTNGSNISTDNANAQAPSPSLKQMQQSVHSAGMKISSLPLTFAQLVDGNYCAKKSGRRKSKSGSKKSPKQQKTVEKELSSVPATEWTFEMLYKKILELENKENESKSENKQDKNYAMKQIMNTFWNGDCKAMIAEAMNGPLNKEMQNIRDFCKKIDIKTNTVIFLQNQNDLSSSYHVLQHDEVYKEKNTYTSSWLNINQLDDIDKEFGLPYFFRYVNHDIRSVNAEPMNGTKTAVLKSEEEKNTDKTKDNYILPVNSLNNTDEEKHNELTHSDPDKEPRAEENTCVSNPQSDDSNYSFKIEVLSPEEAKVIFGQTERDSPQMADSSRSEEIPASDLNDTENQTCHVTPLETICCIEKWEQKFLGSSSKSKCKCEEKDQNEEKLLEVETNNGWLMGLVDLTEGDIPMFTQESENNQGDKNTNNSPITVSSGSEDGGHDLENGGANQTDLEQTEITEDLDTDENVFENSNVDERVMTVSEKLEQVEDYRKEPEESGADTVNPLSSQPENTDNKGKNKTFSGDNFDSLLYKFKKKKLSSNLKSQTILESFSRCKNRRVEIAELALFGSTHKKCLSHASQQSHMQTCERPASEKTEGAPRRVYVKFSPFTESDIQEPETSENKSAKQRIHEKWRNSLPFTTIRLKRKNKKFTVVNANHRTTIRLNPTKYKDKRGPSKRKIRDSDDSEHRRKKTHDEGAKRVLEKLADVEVEPHQENVLKFDVLPNTFNFKEAFNDTDPTTDSKAEDKTVPVATDGNPLLQVRKEAWCDESTSKSAPESPESVPESAGLFQEFQKRYKMRQASMDE